MRALRFRAAAIVAAACSVLALPACSSMTHPTPSQSDTRPQSDTPLEGTDWKLTEAGDFTVPAGLPQPREPHIQLDASSKRASGFTGLNNFNGAYEANGGDLEFGAMATTRRAGPRPVMELESAMLKALGATRSYRISADELGLLDGAGSPLARFAAKRTP